MRFEKQKEFFKKAATFVEKKSFYIMVVLSVAIVIFSGLFITSQNIISSIGYENTQSLQDEMFGENAGKGDEVNLANSDATEKSGNIGAVGSGIKDVAGKNISNTVSSANETNAINANNANKSINGVNGKNTEALSKSKAASIKGAFAASKNEKVGIIEGDKAVKVSGTIQNDSDKKLFLNLPVYGKVSMPFSIDKPIYSKTLNEWRSHEGIDICAEAGTPIKVAKDGTIVEVKNDPRFGYTIIIQHEDGVKTVYSALVDSGTVCVNQKVVAGEVIGTLGNTASFEALEPAHLHFEVIRDGRKANPEDFLQKLSRN